MSKMINFQSLFKFTGKYTLDVYVLKFPEEIYKSFIAKFHDEDYKKRNMRINDLNTILGSYLTDIYYLNFIKSSNLEEGWIFASHDDYITLIQSNLRKWLERIKMDVNEDAIESLEFEKTTIDITPEDLKTDSYKSKLFLNYISRVIASSIELNSINGDKAIPLDIIPVNNHPRNRALCLHPERKVTIKDKNKDVDLYFNYYYDIFNVELKDEEYPYICVEVGAMRLATYDNIKTVNNGSSYSGMHPYIVLNERHRDADGDFKQMAFRAEIGTHPKSNQYIWKRNYTGVLKDALNVEFPSIDKVLENPIDFVNNSEISVLIPHGTHLSKAAHLVGSGMDFKMRNNVLLTIEKELNNLNLISGSLKAEMKNGNNNLKENKDLLSNVDSLKFDLLYTNDETKKAFEAFVRTYNDIENSIMLSIEAGVASPIDKSKKKYLKTIEEGLIESEEYIEAKEKLLFLEEFESKCEKYEGVNLKALKKFYGHLHDKKIAKVDNCIKNFKPIEINYIDCSDLDTYSIKARSKSDKESYIESLKQLELSDDSKVVIVELENKDKFKGKTDPKNLIRKTLASEFGKTTQFFVPFESKMLDGKNKAESTLTQIEINNFASDLITKIFLECIRQEGIVHKRVFETNIAQVGIIKHEKDFFLIAMVGNKTFGKFRDSKWLPFHNIQTLISSSSKITIEDMTKIYSSTYLEDAIDNLFEEFDIKHCYVNILDRQIKNIIPGLYSKEQFNLKVNFSNEPKEFYPYKNDNVSVIVINDTIDSEWFPIEDNENQTNSFSTTLCQINDSLYISTASGRQGVMSSTTVKKVGGKDKLDNFSIAKENYFRSSPIFMYFSKVGKEHNALSIAIFLHFTKSQTAIQHFGTDSTEEIKLPLCLNLAKNLLECYI